MPADTRPDDFDFEAHRRGAVEQYQRLRPVYEAFAGVVQRVPREAITAAQIPVASIEARAKEVESLGDKAATVDSADPSRPKYSDPLVQITDLTGARVIAFFPKAVADAERLIAPEFVVLERVDKAELLWEQERLASSGDLGGPAVISGHELPRAHHN